MSDFTIVPLDTTDHELVQSWLSAGQAVHEHDSVGLAGWHPVRSLVGLVQGYSDRDEFHWVAVFGGQVIGTSTMNLSTLDNTHMADIEVQVRPEHRRRGVGTALLQRMETEAAQAGRTTMSCWASVPIPDGPPISDSCIGFAAHHGYSDSLTTVTRRCDLDKVDDEELQQLWNQSMEAAEGFEVVVFEGTPPDDLIDGFAYLHGRMYTDMPLGEWDLQEADIDADRIRDWERQRREKGELHLQVAVRHKESGDVAGFTEIIIEGGREHHCFQGDTIVDPRFRGHKLGTILKIANQVRIREWRPKMRYVWTGNAETNHHMIAINEAVGYRKIYNEAVYQKKLS
ncbi:GNAT family N-acetyltransferase [Glycomyces buryatensis]|uniref:GNAT family N-acetyltransferase n=1 Tax=Glycomyces buryatensis TaxID=2570927 RepID=A0A4S8QDR1_9ACTN|nr:GNAT family N-acetyltransferase [Glycomyces buryatensis]THV41232.1 GNAT family N-acetyltransferase [Glycomyces buryatensis]